MFELVKVKDVKDQIGQLIKTLRKRDGISQIELSEKLGLSRITIQNLESGKNFTADTLFKVLQHFDLLSWWYEAINKQISDNQKVKSLY